MSLSLVAQSVETPYQEDQLALSMLLCVGQALEASPDLRSGLSRLLDALGHHPGALHCTLLLSGAGPDDCFLQVSRQRNRLPDVIVEETRGQVLRSNRPLVVPQLRSESDHRVYFDGHSRSHVTIAYVCVPVVSERRVIGELGLQLRGRDGDDHAHTVAMLNVAAVMIAQAVKTYQSMGVERRWPTVEDVAGRAGLIGSGAEHVVGGSRQMREVCRHVAQVARAKTTVLIRGESGTGKELIANALHSLSPRSDGPFVKVNCAALPSGLVESELFGHEKGAFTGAVGLKKGRFELAQGGTLFLDEIGELTLAAQVKLLRVLQAREFERLGGTRTIPADIRLVAATNRDLESAIAKGTFRDDLFYRLNVFGIVIPPLRERRSDIVPLASHFVAKCAKRHGKSVKRIASPALDMLMAYQWPGNVRELENAIERATVVCRSQMLAAHDLPATIQRAVGAVGAIQALSLEEATQKFETDILHDALLTTRGNRGKAARLLRTTGRVFNYKVNKYGIDWKTFRR